MTVLKSTVLKSIVRRPIGIAALAFLGLVVIVSVAGSAIAPYNPLAQDTANVLAAPNAAHWLGTDYLGRDILSRLISGTRLSVLAAVEATLVGLLIGATAGVASAYAPRSAEWVLLRVFDSFMALPFITFAVAMGALLGNNIHAAMVAVGILASPTFFRVARAAALTHTSSQYVEAARLFGIPAHRIIADHVIPRIIPTILVTMAIVMASSLLVVASLTFLGVGVQPPTPTWGGMLTADLGYLAQRPWNPLWPSLAIMLTVASLGILADLVRDAPLSDSLPRTTKERTAA